MGILANPNRRSPIVARAFSEIRFPAQFLMATLTKLQANILQPHRAANQPEYQVAGLQFE